MLRRLRCWLRWALVVMALGSVANAWPTSFTRFIDDDGWRSDSSVFECSLTHQIPFYGDAVFKTRAGERSQFYLASDSSRLKSGEASLAARAPVWKEASHHIDLGYVRVKQGLTPIKLASNHTERMLSELLNGLELVFTRRPWYGAEQSTELAITTVGFRAAYRQYLSCLDGLLPVNFDQIRRTSVYFGSNQYEDIRSAELRKLDQIAVYVKADPSVKEFFIDGHTDSVGARDDNIALAEKRAGEVTRYLVNKGVPEAYITSRWHGERYPVAGNQTVVGRSKNRRVTIRLERVELKE